MSAPTYDELRRFVNESNAIEGIARPATGAEIDALGDLLGCSFLLVDNVEAYVLTVARSALRVRPGMDVRVGQHFPPLGGPRIFGALASILDAVSNGRLTPYAAHCAYETLHPFIDGNGRSGRAVWAWHMRREGRDPFRLGFLHNWYYQSLDACDDRKVAV